MDLAAFTSSPLFTWVALPLMIFCLRIIDVTIGTIRIIYVSRSITHLAALFGFFEVLTWLMSITQIMAHLDHYITYLAYAGGFAMGNYVGIYLESRLAVGLVALRVITRSDASELIEHLKDLGIGLTSLAARGITGQVRLVFTVVKRKDLPEVSRIIKEFNPKAFISVEDVRSVSEAEFPAWPGMRAVIGSSLDSRKAK